MKGQTRALLFVLFLGAACAREDAPQPEAAGEADAAGATAPTRFTTEANAAVATELPLADEQDFADAKRGRIDGDDHVEVTDATGKVLFATKPFSFVEGDAPASVNPSLWRQAKLNSLHGLFEVVPGIWQVRGYDVSNMTIIEGSSGWIVVDPLTAKETAAAGWALARRKLGEKPISAFIFTHSHVDHFGGVMGVISAEDAKRVRIVAPKHFTEEATSENVLAGIAMVRRSTFMYGARLPASPRGHVDTGLGRAPVRGTIGILPPTDFVDRTPQEMEIDGLRFVFQYTPDAEAPAELTFYLPDKKAWCGAEIVSHTMHNVYTLRGAKVRDALRWSGFIDEAIRLFPDLEVVYASHSWPIWGRERAVDYLKKQRDTYKYIHDQTLRLANQGLGPQEIAEQIALPESLAKTFANRGYYGTVRHNAKAVYQLYFGWYDANPANLDPLPPVDVARKYVEFMGGAGEVLRKARATFEQGEYRWTATVLAHLVFAEPSNADARELLAATYDQLGYRAESGPWRDVYLSGAYELRHGAPKEGVPLAFAGELLRNMPVERFFDSMAVRLNGPSAEGKTMTLNFVFTDVGETHVVTLDNAVLHHHRRDPDPAATVTVKITRELLVRLVTGQAGLKDLVLSDELDVDGSRLDLLGFFSLLDSPDGRFDLVTR